MTSLFVLKKQATNKQRNHSHKKCMKLKTPVCLIACGVLSVVSVKEKKYNFKGTNSKGHRFSNAINIVFYVKCGIFLNFINNKKILFGLN